MQLIEIDLELNRQAPPQVQNLLAEADLFCDQFFDTGCNRTIPRFIPANYGLVYSALAELKASASLLGLRFCEWGSGLGTATCLASQLGFDAYGIEIESELITRARSFASRSNLPATFLETSFLPEGFDFLSTQGGMELLAPPQRTASSPSYLEQDWALDEIDLFYAYPWPDEQEATLELFRTVACEDAYLLCYYGDNEICAYRK